MSKKEKILKTALTLFNEQGFEKTPTSKISTVAGVATGTLFHHFKTKEELINALYLEVKTQVNDVLREGLDEVHSIREKFQLLWMNYTSWVLAHPEEFQFMVQFRESPYISKETKERIDEIFGYFMEILEEGKNQGLFFNLPLDLVIVLLTSHMMATSYYFLEHPQQFEDTEFQAEVFNSFWNTVVKGKGMD